MKYFYLPLKCAAFLCLILDLNMYGNTVYFLSISSSQFHFIWIKKPYCIASTVSIFHLITIKHKDEFCQTEFCFMSLHVTIFHLNSILLLLMQTNIIHFISIVKIWTELGQLYLWSNFVGNNYFRIYPFSLLFRLFELI